MRPIFLAIFMFLPSNGFAQEANKVNLVSDFWEIVRPAAEISGAKIVGFAAIGELKRSAQKIDVTASIPADWASKNACLKVMSADGLYESQNTYAVSADWKGGSVALEYPSREIGLLEKLPKETIAALLVRGTCRSASAEATPVQWGSAGEGILRILLNTSRASETYIFFPENPDIPDITCEVVSFMGRNGFDTFCDVPSGLAENGQLDARIVSFKNGEMGREEVMMLRFGVQEK